MLSELLSPTVFLRLPKEIDESVTIIAILSLMTKVISSRALIGSLSCFSVGDPGSAHIMSIDALEDWLYQMAQRLVQIEKMTEQFVPLWVFTAAHTIAFFHGKQHASRLVIGVPGSSRVNTTSTRVNIRDFVESETMGKLLQLNKQFVEDIESNPFSRIRAVRFYDSFTVFESGRSVDFGLPVTDSCSIFAGGYMNPVFMERLLDSTGGPGMDYRRFLSFAIAWENRRTAMGVKYFWPVLDWGSKGYVTKEDVGALVAGIVSVLKCLPVACVSEETLIDEISDIFTANSKSSSPVLTLEDALSSPCSFGTVVGLLGNTQAFIEYECREDVAHKHFLARQVRQARQARLRQGSESRAGQLAVMQQLIDDCWFDSSSGRAKFDSFATFLDHHETVYGGESMEPWLTKYYQWEAEESENTRLHFSRPDEEVALVQNDPRRDEETSPRE